MFQKIINIIALRNFFEVELTSAEREIAIESVRDKYSKALRSACIYCTLSILPILFLETQVLISVLIPITMVAGTAWFSISLANMKQKFESFGLELTANLFEAFTVSLGLLFMLSVFSLGGSYTNILQETFISVSFIEPLAVFAGVIIIGNIIYKIFIGSIQYDINDAMLTGQNEAAEKFYRKSLSLLHSVSNSLRSGNSLQVANYYIGVAFFEVFSYIENLKLDNIDTKNYKNIANNLIKNPSMSQQNADKSCIELIHQFLILSINIQGFDSKKSIEAINDELDSISNNPNEDQDMKDTRFAIIFEEIANLLESQGETLFKK